MKFVIIKQVSFLSFILGLFLGILLLIPVINLLTFLFVMFFVGGAIVLFLKKFNMVGIIDIKEGAVIGAIAGFTSFLGVCTSYIPISSLLGLIFSKYTGGFATLFLSSISGLITGLFMIVFSALMSALLNSFSGLVAIWGWEIVTGVKKENTQNLDFQIK